MALSEGSDHLMMGTFFHHVSLLMHIMFPSHIPVTENNQATRRATVTDEDFVLFALVSCFKKFVNFGHDLFACVIAYLLLIVIILFGFWLFDISEDLHVWLYSVLRTNMFCVTVVVILIFFFAPVLTLVMWLVMDIFIALRRFLFQY